MEDILSHLHILLRYLTIIPQNRVVHKVIEPTMSARNAFSPFIVFHPFSPITRCELLTFWKGANQSARLFTSGDPGVVNVRLRSNVELHIR